MKEGPGHMVFPLETLLIRLEKEGFSFGVDVHLRLQNVLHSLGQSYIQQPEKLRHILSPILVKSAEESQKFDWVFNEYIEKVVSPYIESQLSDKPIVDPSASAIVVDPEVRKHITFRSRVLPLLAAVILAGVALGLLLVQNKESVDSFSPSFMVIANEQREIGIGDTVYVGENIQFRNRTDESLEKFLGRSIERKELAELKFEWDLGEGLSGSIVNKQHATHIYTQEGLYLITLRLLKQKSLASLNEVNDSSIISQSIQVICKEKPKLARFSYTPSRIQEGDFVNFTFEVAGANSIEYQSVWKLDGKPISPKNLVFEQAGEFTLTLKAYSQTAQTVCDTLFHSALIQVIQDEKPTVLKPLDMKYDPGGETQISFTYLATLLPSLFLIGLIFMIDKVRLKQRRKRLLNEGKNDFNLHDQGPYEIPYPNKNYLLHADNKVFGLSKSLRQRRTGERKKVDLFSTIKATAKSLGLLELKFKSTSKASEYLILIEQKHPQSHLTRLFDRLVTLLKGEDVILECFYFDTDLRVCWNVDFPNGITFSLLRQRFSRHRLLIYSDAYHMVDPYEAKLKDWVPEMMSIWKNRAALVTPIPPVDWGYKERLLFQIFNLFSANLFSQETLVQVFTSSEDFSFAQAKENACVLQGEDQESLLDYDFQQLEDLRIYLSDPLFEWLAATMVYPLPTWPMTLAVGRALSSRQHAEYLLTYDNILRISRIPWMQTGLISPRLRRQLLGTISPETEQIAREAILEVLDEIEIGKNSHAGKKHVVQLISNQFLTDPGDEEIARKMYVLWKKNELNDSVVEETLYKPLPHLEGDTAEQYLQTRFEKITPMRSLVKAMWGTVLVGILTFWLHTNLDQDPLLKEYSQKYKLESLGLTGPVEFLDSAAYFNDKGVDAYVQGDLLEARKQFYKAIQFRHYKKWKELDPSVKLQEGSKEPIWQVVLSLPGDNKPRVVNYSIRMLEELHNLDKIQSEEAFDLSLLGSFTNDQSRINGNVYDSVSFRNYPQFDAFPGMLAPYLFVRDYPIGGANLLSLVMYNEGVETFNQSEFKAAIEHFTQDAKLLSGELLEVNRKLLEPLYLDVLHGVGLSYYYDNQEDSARSYLERILFLNKDFFKSLDEQDYHLEDLLVNDFLGKRRAAQAWTPVSSQPPDPLAGIDTLMLENPRVEDVASNVDMQPLNPNLQLAETQFRQGNISGSRNTLRDFLRYRDANRKEYYAEAYYGIAWTWMKEKNYKNALQGFKDYIANAGRKGKKDQVVDAFLRSGDCLFLLKQYKDANTYYQRVVDFKDKGADYAMYQKGESYYRQNNYQASVNEFDKLIRGLKRSSYRDDALDRISEIYATWIKDNSKASFYARKLVEEYPKSPLAAAAFNRLALASYYSGDEKAAVRYFKRVLSNYAQDQKNSQIALDNLSALLSEREFDRVLKDFRNSNPEMKDNMADLVFNTGQDRFFSLGYSSAIDQFTTYIRDYKNGPNYYESFVFRARSYRELGDFEKALRDYQKVYDTPSKNEFTIVALQEAGEIRFNQRDYQSSLALYQELEAVADEVQNRVTARFGIAKNYSAMKDYNLAINVYRSIAQNQDASSYSRTKALLGIGNNQYLNGKLIDAYDTFADVESEFKNAFGAEAQYMITKILLAQGLKMQERAESMDRQGRGNADQAYQEASDKLTETTEAVIYMNNNYPSFNEWKARTFLVAADAYVALGNTFQAKKNLESLANEERYPDIQRQAIEKLQMIKILERR